MSATNSFESEILRHILLNEAIEDLGDSSGVLPSSADGNVYIALLTQDPGEAGSITNECVFGGYARVAVPRGATGFAEANGEVRNFADIDFPECTSGAEQVTHFAVCKTLDGDDMMFHGELSAPALVSIDVQLRITANQLSINVD